MTDQRLLSRITSIPEIFGGKPIIRGMRISVELILSLLAQAETPESILDDYPELEADDILACMAYAHAVIAEDSLDAVSIASVKFLVDRCAGLKLAEHLSASGHDVIRATELGPDPGDEVLLQFAHADQRIPITIDTDFGALLFLKHTPHSGLIRLPDVPPQRRIELMDLVLSLHSTDLEQGVIVTVRGGRIRISRQPPKIDDLQ